jgi:hypothetical protein
MAVAGIFGTAGVWSLGFDFLANGTITPGGVLDYASGGGSLSVGAAYARFSIGKGLLCSGGSAYIGKNLNSQVVSVYSGFGYSVSQLPGGGQLSAIFTAYDNSAAVVNATLALNSSGQLQFYQAGGLTPSGVSTPTTAIGPLSTAGTIVAGAYYFVEVHIVPAASGGILECRVNGTVVCTYSGNTLITNPWTTTIFLGAGGGSSVNNSFDDWYLSNALGPSPLNTYLGPGRVQTDIPTGDSATPGLNAWQATNPIGTDYGNCANIPPNSAEYNFSPTIDQRMSLSFPALSGYSSALFLNTWFSVEEDNTGTRGVTPIFRSNSVDQDGSAISLPTSYTYYSQASAIDPNTSNPWASGTITAAQNCEIGLLVSS